MPIGDILPEITLIIGAVLIILFAAFTQQKRQNGCFVLALITLILAIALTLNQFSLTHRVTFNGVWVVDIPAIVAKLIILFATVVTVLLSPEWFRQDRRRGEYYALVLFSSLGAMILASAYDGMELIVGILLSSTASYPLIAFHRNWAMATEAGMKFFLLSALANALLLISMVLLFGWVGDTDYHVVRLSMTGTESNIVIVALTACMLTGLCFKLAAFPVHTWMPDVAQGSPAPVAALLSVVPKVGAAIALVRFVELLPDDLNWRMLIALIAAATMTIGNLGALQQNDVRRLLGWSSVSQSGYALIALAVLGLAPQALSDLLFFLIAYSVANLAAFSIITVLRGRTDLKDFSGLASARPTAAMILVISMLSLVGIPPLIGFFGKLRLFTATISADYLWLAVTAIANTVLSLFYYLRVVREMYFKPCNTRIDVLGPLSSGTAVFLGCGVIGLGLAVEVLLAVFDKPVFTAQ